SSAPEHSSLSVLFVHDTVRSHSFSLRHTLQSHVRYSQHRATKGGVPKCMSSSLRWRTRCARATHTIRLGKVVRLWKPTYSCSMSWSIWLSATDYPTRVSSL